MAWSSAKFLLEFRRSVVERIQTVERKNADYSGATEDPFGNFALIEALTHGRISMEDGIVVRMTDKLARLATLLTRDPAVVGESFGDTCGDLSAYAEILALARRSRTEPEEAPIPVPPQEAVPVEQASALERLRHMIAQMAQNATPGGLS